MSHIIIPGQKKKEKVIVDKADSVSFKGGYLTVENEFVEVNINTEIFLFAVENLAKSYPGTKWHKVKIKELFQVLGYKIAIPGQTQEIEQ